MAKRVQGIRSRIERKQNSQAGLLACMLLCLTALTSALVFAGLYQVQEADHVIVLIQNQVGASGSETTGNGSLSVTADADASIATGSDFLVYDDSISWTTDTSVEIFRLSYENETGTITVASDTGDAVFAPGTSNSYTFHLKNTGETGLDYTMWMESSVSSETYALPILVRVQSSEGIWILGDEDTWTEPSELNTVLDAATLGAGRYVWYTLEWQWPFESGTDEYDTFLGNLALEEDLSLTITIYTSAVISEEASDGEDAETVIGSTSPKTGDETPLMQILLLGLGAALVFLATLGWKRKKRSV